MFHQNKSKRNRDQNADDTNNNDSHSNKYYKLTQEEKRILQPSYHLLQHFEDLVLKGSGPEYKTQQTIGAYMSRTLENAGLKSYRSKLDELDEEINKEKGESQIKFNVSYRFSRDGERKIVGVNINGRPPTELGSSQGDHTVAISLFEHAIKKIVVGTTFLPDDQMDKSVVYALEKILDFEKASEVKVVKGKKKKLNVDKRSIEMQLRLLRARKVQKFEKKDFMDGDHDTIKQTIRKNQSTIRQDLNIVTANIVRLWNKRPMAIYEKDDPIEFRAGISSRESSALAKLSQEWKELAGTDEADVSGLEGGDETEALKDLNAKNLARLIDIRSLHDFEEEYKRNHDGVAPENKLKEKHGKILNSSIKEAIRLAKLILKSPPNNGDMKKAIDAAIIEDLQKKEKTLKEKKEKGETLNDKDTKSLEYVTKRLESLKPKK